MTTEDVEGPRLATADDFPGILDLVDRCFSHPDGGMLAHWCHVYDIEQPERHAVVCADGEVVSHISIVEDELVIGDDTITCWGFTGVGTDPRYRGRGFMSDILDLLVERMADHEIPLAKLGGDRIRYGRWGWERGGPERRYRITDRYLDVGDGENLTLHRYQESADEIDLFDRLYREKRYRVQRDREHWRTVLNRQQFTTLYTDAPGTTAYAVFTRGRENRRRSTVTEMAGDEAGLRAILHHIVTVFGNNTISVRAHPSDPLNAFLAKPDVCGSWDTGTNRSLRLNCLPDVITAYQSEMTQSCRAYPVESSSATLAIEEDDDPITVEWDGEDVTVERTDASPDIRLDRMAMTRLLFWDGRTVDGYDRHPLVEAITPLQYWAPKLDQV